MRCLALAQAWIDAGAEVRWLAADLLAASRDRVVAEGIQITLQGEGGHQEADADQTAQLASRVHADWVVLDGYAFGAFHQAILRKAGHRVLFVDDNSHATEYTADIVLNQNVHANQSLYAKKDKGSLYLLGPRYALLRREFRLHSSPAKAIPLQARNFLIILGGTGNIALARLVLGALRLLAGRLRFEVRLVLGGAVCAADIVLQGKEDWLTTVSYLEDMPAALAWSDMVLSCAGSTVYELMRMGVPSLLVVAADNQRAVAEKLHDTGICVNLGPQEALAAGDVARAIEALATDQNTRAEMSKKGQSEVDAQGAVRVRNAMQSGLLRLRPVCAEDMRMTWDWANDPEARAVSFSTAPIPWEDHVRWFGSRLGDAMQRMFIGETPDGAPVGLVRFELSASYAVISVSIDRASRGEGYGRWLIWRASLEILRHPGVREVYAYIKSENAASIRVFESAGFCFHSRTTVKDKPAVVFRLSERSP
jgi:UDP-2,4-diacetamido-2,4,6-trideoxy-beta-L-altropyranose hydrolase